jgi:hypothetical protein
MVDASAARDLLQVALAADVEWSGTPHVVVALPSYSVGESLLAHYGDRLMALEHRYLLSLLLAHRMRDVEVVHVSSWAPSPEVLALYRDLGPDPAGLTARTHVLSVEDRSPRCVAEKLLERPDVLDRIRAIIGGRPALLEPWNVTDHEVRVADSLGIPVNGMDPLLRPLGFKSAGRRLFRDVGVPVPRGVEDVRSVDDVVHAVDLLRRMPEPPGAVVVKHDDSGAGDGNAILELTGPPVRDQLAALPEWYLADLALGGVVEELVAGVEVSSPSAQVDLLPDGQVQVLATHEQLLGGDNGQVFQGCRFPADPAYAAGLARHAEATGRALADQGVLGRVAVDFVCTRSETGAWAAYALEVNLRKGGTTHPYTVLRSLVPGRYDAVAGQWIARSDSLPRAYVCTDNLVDPVWRGARPRLAIEALRAAGLLFDHVSGVGVVPHMLAGLEIDGRFGIVAIGRDADEADGMLRRVREAVGAELVNIKLPG